jgi:hypothetical protein
LNICCPRQSRKSAKRDNGWSVAVKNIKQY